MTNMSANKQNQPTDTKLINETEANYLEICRQMNMDKDTERAAWQSYLEISQNCTLQGEQSHWLCCSIYTACRESFTPTVGDSRAVVAGNCISLTKLLRSCNISISEFCQKIKIWADIRNLSKQIRGQIERLERSFQVSYCTYQNYEKLFLDLFVISTTERKKKKAKPGRCSASKLYDFCWCLFIAAKGEEPKYRTDLVTSVNLLLCCLNLIFVNAVLDDRRDIINPNFVGLPKNWNQDDFDVTSLKKFNILRELCKRFSADLVEVENLRKSTWRTIVGKLIKHKTLLCDSLTDLNVISNVYFEPNLKSLNNSYEQYILSVGEFDERIFLNSDKERHLANNSYVPGTPVSTFAAIQYLENLAAKEIPKNFVDIIGPEMLRTLEGRLDEMRDVFLEKCPNQETVSSADIFRLSRPLFFDFLEKIIRNELRIKPQVELKILLENRILQDSLISCCVEIVIFIRKANLPFPWILSCFQLNSYNFYKIIEIIVAKHENVLNRPTITHLNTIESLCLDHLNWSSDSELWNAIKRHNGPLPTYEQVDHRNAANVSSSCRKLEDTGLRFFQSPCVGVNHQAHPQVAESARRDLFNAAQSKKSREPEKPVEASPPKPRAGSLFLFFRKFYELAYNRISRLCDGLKMKNNDYPGMIWTLFEYCIIHKTEIMRDRHLDQIIMCTIYVLIKVKDIPDRHFTEIMQLCRQDLKVTSSIYRHVLLERKDGQPTYGDIIQFYNSVYVQSMSPFALHFADKNKQEKNLLSPHPPDRLQSPRKVGSYQIFVQPLDKKVVQISPNRLTYEFSKSPSKDLLKINEITSGKRRQDDNTVVSKRSRLTEGTCVENKIRGIIQDRQKN